MTHLIATISCFMQNTGKERNIEPLQEHRANGPPHSRIIRTNSQDDGAYAGWELFAEGLHDRDKGSIHAFTEELAGFLNFSAIFCTVVTVFIGQTNNGLQPDNSQLTVDILRNISVQLGGANGMAPVAAVDVQPFQPDILDVVLNSLLNASLLCSLIASALSLWALQWLREYSIVTPDPPREVTRIRQYRYEGLMAWNIHFIVTAISVILQLSVLLFSIGVVMLARKTDGTLFLVLLVLNSLWWAVTWLAAICPLFSARCPFKSPLSRILFKALYYTRKYVVCGAMKTGSTFEARERYETEKADIRTKLEEKALEYMVSKYRGDVEKMEKISKCFRMDSQEPCGGETTV